MFHVQTTHRPFYNDDRSIDHRGYIFFPTNVAQEQRRVHELQG